MAILSPILKMVLGLVFFLFGMNVMSQNLEKMAGSKLEKSLKTMTKNPFVSLLLGAIITIAVQSSSATTVMLVGLVNSGIMSFSQTLYVIFGANIGTTLTAWILSLAGIQSDAVWLQMLKPENFSPIFALIGIILTMFAKKNKNKSIGFVLIGFSVLMSGMTFMTDAVEPLAQSSAFANLLITFTSPILALLVATLFTGIIQSSAASIGILQALSVTGGITYWMAIPIIMGQNIGTCVTALISSVGANSKAKRVAVLNILIKIMGTVIILGLFYAFVFISNLRSDMDAPVNYIKIAVIHTAFNVITTAIFMPIGNFLIKITEKIVPDNASTQKNNIFVLDERVLKSPSIAVGECNSASNEMSSKAFENIKLAMSLFVRFDKKISEKVNENEDIIDKYEDILSNYLVQLSSQNISRETSKKVSKILHSVGDFERLGDHALNLEKVARELYEKEVFFSEEAKSQITILEKAIYEIIDLTRDAYINEDIEKAEMVEPLEQVIDDIIQKIKIGHINRLQTGNCTIELGFALSDVLTNYERISDHCSNIAVAVIELKNQISGSHQYLHEYKHTNTKFNSYFDSYSQKYTV